MKSIEELEQLYESDLKEKLEALETKRIKVRNAYIFTGLFILIAGLLIFLGTQNVEYEYLMYLAIPFGIGVIYFIYRISVSQGKYRSEFKTNVVQAIVHLINPEWHYNPNSHIPLDVYQRSKLFTKGVDRYKGDDLVHGVIEKTDFQFSELHSEYKTETRDKNGRKQTSWHTIFKGLFAHLDFNKEIKGETLVLPDTAESLLGSFGKKLQSMSGRGKLINMENVEFEKLFVVYGSDQIEARYVLTPTMMEAMIRIKKEYNKDVYFSFIGSRVFFAISISKDLFEPRIFSSGVKFDDILEMNRYFGIIDTIIHEMNLNTRIWTKD